MDKTILANLNTLPQQVQENKERLNVIDQFMDTIEYASTDEIDALFA